MVFRYKCIVSYASDDVATSCPTRFLNVLISESGMDRNSFLKDKLVGRKFGQRECSYILLLQVNHIRNIFIKNPFKLFFHNFFFFFTLGMIVESV